VNAPYKVCKYDKKLPAGVKNYVNESADDFLALLRKGGVAVLDLRDALHADGLNHYEMFYKTEHHWTIPAAFWANRKIIEYLAGHGLIANYNAAILDKKNWTATTFKNCFLGSQGRRVGTLFDGMDDCTFFEPRFQTNLSMTIPLRHIHKSGAWKDVVINPHFRKFYGNPRAVKSHSPFTVAGAYEEYSYSNNPIVIFKNENALIQKKIFLISDSFGEAMRGFLALSFHEVHQTFGTDGTWDAFHQYRHSYRDYIKEQGFNMVILMFVPDVMPRHLGQPLN
jgi:hypothetical protein